MATEFRSSHCCSWPRDTLAAIVLLAETFNTRRARSAHLFGSGIADSHGPLLTDLWEHRQETKGNRRTAGARLRGPRARADNQLASRTTVRRVDGKNCKGRNGFSEFAFGLEGVG